MTCHPPSLGWSRGRWLATSVGILALQVVLLFLLSARPSPPSARPHPLGHNLLLIDPAANRWLNQQVWLEDPAQLALVGPRSFSAAAWFSPPRFTPDIRGGTEPPRFLDLDPVGLGLAHGASPPVVLWRAPVAQIPSPTTALMPLQTGSVLRVEGALAGRPLLTPLTLPSWDHADVLQPTTLQIVVDRSGASFPPILLTPSGLQAADQRALEVARTARFAPAPAGPNQPSLAWGRLVFLWHATLPPAATIASTPTPGT